MTEPTGATSEATTVTDDADEVLVPYRPAVADDAAEPETVRSGWEVVRDDRTGEWSLFLFEITADGGEDLIGEMPLDPQVAAEMSAAMASAYNDMTGDILEDDAAGEEFAGQVDSDGTPWWRRSSWTRSRNFQIIVLTVVGVLVLIAFIVNLIFGR